MAQEAQADGAQADADVEAHEVGAQGQAPLLAADMIVLEEADHRVGGPFVLYFLTLMEHAMAHNGALLSPNEVARLSSAALHP